MYKLTGVKKDYQKGRDAVRALQGVDLTIDDGEWLAIQGPTGHGKSTLLQMLGGLDRPTSGSVQFGDRASDDLAQLREAQVTRLRAVSIGFIFQTFNLVPTLSAAENVEAALIPLHRQPFPVLDHQVQVAHGGHRLAPLPVDLVDARELVHGILSCVLSI